VRAYWLARNSSRLIVPTPSLQPPTYPHQAKIEKHIFLDFARGLVLMAETGWGMRWIWSLILSVEVRGIYKFGDDNSYNWNYRRKQIMSTNLLQMLSTSLINLSSYFSRPHPNHFWLIGR